MNERKNQRDNQDNTIQIHRQHWAQNTDRRQAKQKYKNEQYGPHQKFLNTSRCRQRVSGSCFLK